MKKKFLSFDIECSTNYKDYTPICNFGYVIYDDNFNLLEKRDIIINPRARFKLTNRKNQKNIQMYYPIEVYNKSPIFMDVYKEIKDLLEDDNFILIGQTVKSDINYLNYETNVNKKNIGLAPINFKIYDLQDIMKKYYDIKKYTSIENLKTEMNLDFYSHKADDDADVVMHKVSEILKESQLTFEGLVEKYSISVYENKEGIIVDPYLSPMEKIKLEIKKLTKTKNINSFYQNKTFSFSIYFEDKNEMLEIAQFILNIGGVLTKKVSDSDYFIKSNKSLELDKRYDSAIFNEVEIITVENLLNN